MSDNKISVIIPIYSKGKFIRPTLDSVLAQTYKNLEIILGNDGSKGGFSEIIGEANISTCFICNNSSL